jgi:hypothetical protein
MGERESIDSPLFHQHNAPARSPFASPFGPAPTEGPRPHPAYEPPLPEPNLSSLDTPVVLPAPDPAETLNTADEPGPTARVERWTESPWPTPDPALLPAPAVAPAAVPSPSTSTPAGSSRPVLTAFVALVFGMAGGLVVATLKGSGRTPAEAPRPVAGPEARTPSALLLVNSEAEARTKAIDELKSEINQVMLRLNSLGARLEKVAEAAESEKEPPQELAELRAQVGQLAAAAGDVASVQKDLKRIDNAVFDLYATLRSYRDELAVRTQAAKPVAPTGAGAGDDTGGGSDDARTLAQGVKLFKQSRV